MLSERLSEMRKSRNLTMKNVADSIGIGLSAYQKYENGTRDISTENLIKLAEFYGVTTDYLLGLETPETGQNPVDFLIKKYNLDPLEQKILREYVALPDKTRENVMDFLKRTVAAKENKENGGD